MISFGNVSIADSPGTGRTQSSRALSWKRPDVLFGIFFKKSGQNTYEREAKRGAKKEKDGGREENREREEGVETQPEGE